MPTIAGLRRRGYTASALREFCERIGVAKANSEVETGQLESCIRDELNAGAERAMAVLDPIEMVITNRDDSYSESADMDINPNDENAGKREVTFTNRLYIERADFEVVPPPKYKRLIPDGYVRLKGAYIVKCVGYDLDDEGKVVRVYAQIIEGTKSGTDNSGVKAKGVIHWVNAKDCVDATVRLYDYLLLPYDGVHEDFSERLNPNSVQVMNAKVEKYLANAKPLQSFQFMRQGYFCRDCKDEGLVFNQVVSLKDGYKK